MTLARDLAWQNLDLVYRSSIAHQFARYGLGLSYDMLPENVVHQAKRSLLDSLGCAIGAYDAPGRAICEDLARELGGPREATLFGSGRRTSALNATFVNSFLVRYLDYNDMGGGIHSSDAIAAVLAVAERQKAGGREFLTAMVISYELGARFNEANITSSFEEKGWTADVRGGLNMPPALGKLMGLNEEQIANAIGICASRSLPLGILDAHREENTMSKDIRFGWVAYDAILACMLARRGFTGPVRVVEGDAGLLKSMAKGDMDLERMTNFSGWRILNTNHKVLCANGSTIAHILATLAIVKENNLKPGDIASVQIKASTREAMHTTTPAKKWPRNGESADHSAFYGNALAIKERAFGPDSFEPGKFTDPVVLDLIEKITVEADPTLPRRGGGSIITTKDGRRFEKRIVSPHGVGDDPMSDAELEDKFKEMAARRLPRAQMRNLIEMVWNVDKLDDAGKLAALMVFPSRK
ncbi:MAG: MmgE/PrpD family protein [Dehalococcoidales bacterium]|nr:MmgE/PrpD family protein [Dehalococcoidales bacterium]